MSEELRIELEVVGIGVTEDIEVGEGDVWARIKFDGEEKSVHYDGTDKGFIESLDELAAKDNHLWDYAADFHRIKEK